MFNILNNMWRFVYNSRHYQTGGVMPTSSITKSFVIKDTAALERLNAEMARQPSSIVADKDRLEKDREKLKQYLLSIR